MIYSYFHQYPELIGTIKSIIIDDDLRISLIGNIAGKVCKSGMPLHGWKKYWYGQYRVGNQLFEETMDKSQITLNFRFDILNNSNPVPPSKIIQFAKTCLTNNIKSIQSIQFIDNKVTGIDNIYFGTVQLNYTLAHIFHTQLDAICAQNQSVANQEKLVFIVSQRLTASNLFNPLIHDKIHDKIHDNDEIIQEKLKLNEKIKENASQSVPNVSTVPKQPVLPTPTPPDKIKENASQSVPTVPTVPKQPVLPTPTIINSSQTHPINLETMQKRLDRKQLRMYNKPTSVHKPKPLVHRGRLLTHPHPPVSVECPHNPSPLV
jgi:hypothetical protein